MILLTATKELCGLHSPDVAEAIGVCWAIQIAISHGFSEVEVESDCLLLVQAFSNHRDISLLDMLAVDIHDLASKFSFFSFNHVFRAANRVTHFISKNGCGSPDPFCYSGFSRLLLHLAHAYYLNSSVIQ